MGNLLFKTQLSLTNKQWTNGIGSYSQSNCKTTLTENGFRIYRPPNLIYPDCGTTTWGGLVLRTYQVFDLIKNHSYILIFDVSGQTTCAPVMYWTNQAGWGGGGLTPNPTNVSYQNISTNFNGNQQCFYRFTISDDVYKICTNSYSGFIQGNTYLSYRDFLFGFGYENTGVLGTDLYITNIRMFDITNNSNIQVEVEENGNVNINTSIYENTGGCSFGNELYCNEIIEL